ncbi:MAG: hypothetical protein GXP45_08480 [bacterium]|nr:hypothetical protein [bacterium]
MSTIGRNYFYIKKFTEFDGKFGFPCSSSSSNNDHSRMFLLLEVLDSATSIFNNA